MKVFLFFVLGVFLLFPDVASACPNDCCDCGKSGWQLMEESCLQPIIKKTDFKICLSRFSWTGVTADSNAEDDMEEGYLKIGGMERLKTPSFFLKKVIFYRQWAVDKKGKLYLLGQLG